MDIQGEVQGELKSAWVVKIYSAGADFEIDAPVERSVFWASNEEDAERIAQIKASDFSGEVEWQIYQDDNEAETLILAEDS